MPEEWLTYREIGTRLGLHVEAVRTRVRRAGWRTQPGSDGRTRVLVSDQVFVEPVSEDDRRLNKTGDLDAARIAEAEAEADVAKARKADEARKGEEALGSAPDVVAGGMIDSWSPCSRSLRGWMMSATWRQ